MERDLDFLERDLDLRQCPFTFSTLPEAEWLLWPLTHEPRHLAFMERTLAFTERDLDFMERDLDLRQCPMTFSTLPEAEWLLWALTHVPRHLDFIERDLDLIYQESKIKNFLFFFIQTA